VLVGLPDTVWFPEDGYRALPDGGLSFILFPVEQPQLFDAVVVDDERSGRVREIQVKQPVPATPWVWGGFRVSGGVLRELYALWKEREQKDVYVGTLVNEYIARGGVVTSAKAGTAYFDVGTFDGYRRAIQRLGDESVEHERVAL
jgi:dTDP-glucose pyrophosphorylase